MSDAMTRIAIRSAVLATLVAVVALPATPASAAFSDVPSTHWAKTAIEHVAQTNDWLRNFGTSLYKPEAVTTKRVFARALVRAYDRAGVIDPSITFTDVSTTDGWYRDINIAVKHGWMTKNADGSFRPTKGVSTTQVHRGLTVAMGLQAEIDGLSAIATSDGAALAVNKGRFPYLVLGMQLGFRANHGNESEEVGPGTILKRDEVAWSLWKAKTAASWQVSALTPYRSITLPVLTSQMRKVAEFGFAYVGYPYVWAGEWHVKTPTGYCCGAQPVGGFDCSGFMWWVLKKPGGGYDNVSIRGYSGWALPERSSSAMASAAPAKITYANTLPGDLMFYDSTSNPGVVSHVNVYLGNGWALDSSSSRGGSSVIKVDSGWYRDRFLWSRRLSA